MINDKLRNEIKQRQKHLVIRSLIITYMFIATLFIIAGAVMTKNMFQLFLGGLIMVLIASISTPVEHALTLNRYILKGEIKRT